MLLSSSLNSIYLSKLNSFSSFWITHQNKWPWAMSLPAQNILKVCLGVSWVNIDILNLNSELEMHAPSPAVLRAPTQHKSTDNGTDATALWSGMSLMSLLLLSIASQYFSLMLMLGLMEFALTPDYLQLVWKYFSSEEIYLADNMTTVMWWFGECKDRLMSGFVISTLCSLCRL